MFSKASTGTEHFMTDIERDLLDISNVMTIQEVEVFCAIQRKTVVMAIYRNQITAIKVNNAWLVSVSSVRRWRKNFDMAAFTVWRSRCF